MSNSISFTAAGIDVQSIVSGLIAVDRQPIDRLTTRQSAVKLQSDAVGRLRSNFESLKNLASGLVTNGISKFSSTVRRGNKRRPSGTSAMPRSTTRSAGRPRIERPSKSTSPPAGASRPASARSSVLLPAPLAPIKATHSAASTSKSTPCSTSTLP